MIKTKRGLDLPIIGSPKQSIESGPEVRQVALVGYDYPGLKPTMEVREGDTVKAGQLVFTDKKTDGVRYTAPASGTVKAINRGDKRVFESLVIEMDGSEGETFASYSAAELRGLDREKVVENLVASGQWTAIRTRPYSRVPSPAADQPSAFFVTAADSRPHCPDPALFINEQSEAYLAGIDVLSRLTEGKVYVCSNAGSELPQSDNPQVVNESFSGPHPSGNVGTHIHFLHPVHTNRSVWHAGYQDVIAIGQLFLTGKIFSDRVIALSGPEVSEPRVIRTCLGASTEELTSGQLIEGNNRVISGSIVDGRRAADGTAFLGRFHNQVAAIHEGTERELLEFVSPGMNKFSLTRLYLGCFRGGLFRMSTSTEGSERSIIPIGTYERVMPLDILPVPLLKALIVGDFDASIELGVLELDEEDIALCTFACPGKYEYGPYLREMLTRIEVES
jgi:Na+-transporting NADH:ubiquinone oxidoreductase subunit A